VKLGRFAIENVRRLEEINGLGLGGFGLRPHLTDQRINHERQEQRKDIAHSFISLSSCASSQVSTTCRKTSEKSEIPPTGEAVKEIVAAD
jgi:hypothetical protein